MTATPSALGERYTIGQVIAVGGSATIAHAHDARLDRAVAIKRPRTDDCEARERIHHEATILARLAHPNVVACLDVIEDAAALALVLQLVDGPSLVERAEAARTDGDTARSWAVEVCRAVAHVHGRGVVHGDLKPQHIVIAGDGHAILVDFDRAHDAALAAPELASGVEAYAAPEVRRGAATSIASDCYALGAVLRWLAAHSEVGERWDAILAPLLGADATRRAGAADIASALAAR